ncbi:VOC family protein [Consotaella aegiceratis]|uniref:VOC family protein n=1 Tax=Consotaella aegiceratis TaxID=3097961 RepID=UPI002F41D36B
MLRGFEHVGMTISNVDATIAFYVDLLGFELVSRRTGRQGHELLFLQIGDVMLEMVCPATETAPADDVPDGRAGLRHLTFWVDDVEAMAARLEAAGVEMVVQPRLAENTDIVRKVAFCRDPDSIMIELVERSAGRLGR